MSEAARTDGLPFGARLVRRETLSAYANWFAITLASVEAAKAARESAVAGKIVALPGMKTE